MFPEQLPELLLIEEVECAIDFVTEMIVKNIFEIRGFLKLVGYYRKMWNWNDLIDVSKVLIS